MKTKNRIIEEKDIKRAQKIIEGRLHRTPLVHSQYLSTLLNIDLYFKCELFQKTGSFKVRGVINKLDDLSQESLEKGVISISAGNHAQALAWGASFKGIRSTIVMPETAVTSKIEATRAYGGEVVLTAGNLLDACQAIQEERQLTMVHPFDDLMMIAGHGSIGLEILEDLEDVETVVVSIGGGGLISGVATAVKLKNPKIKVIGVEPFGAAAMTKSIQKGEPVHLKTIDTIADGLAAPFAGKHTLLHVSKFVDEIVLVDDTEIKQAMGLILERCKLLAEPAAASTLAALISDKIQCQPDSKTVCILSGGNIDRERLKTFL